MTNHYKSLFFYLDFELNIRRFSVLSNWHFSEDINDSNIAINSLAYLAKHIKPRDLFFIFGKNIFFYFENCYLYWHPLGDCVTRQSGLASDEKLSPDCRLRNPLILFPDSSQVTPSSHCSSTSRIRHRNPYCLCWVLSCCDIWFCCYEQFSNLDQLMK